MLIKTLIVDNDLNALKRWRAMPVWAEQGFELAAQVFSLGEALRLVRSREPELVVVLDKPPIISPAELIKRLSSAAPHVVFIVISPRDDSESMRECFLLGAIDYLSEPVSQGRLASALKRAEEQLKKSTVGREYQLAAEEFFAGIAERRPPDKFSEKLKRFILESEGVTVSTENAADYFGFNKDYYGRLFKQEFGITFGEFYRQFRVLYAEKLLMTGRYKVYEVSELLGFSSVDYFTSVFKRVTGKRPSELKRL